MRWISSRAPACRSRRHAPGLIGPGPLKVQAADQMRLAMLAPPFGSSRRSARKRDAGRATAICSRLDANATGPDPAASAASGAILDRLTARERDVLKLVSEGLSNHEIAKRLGRSEHTVHRHISNILTKLDLPSRAAAAAAAVRSGAI